MAFSDGGGAPVDHGFFGELLQLEDGKRSEARFFNSNPTARGGI
jgi:hypothetical protein